MEIQVLHEMHRRPRNKRKSGEMVRSRRISVGQSDDRSVPQWRLQVSRAKTDTIFVQGMQRWIGQVRTSPLEIQVLLQVLRLLHNKRCQDINSRSKDGCRCEASEVLRIPQKERSEWFERSVFKRVQRHT